MKLSLDLCVGGVIAAARSACKYIRRQGIIRFWMEAFIEELSRILVRLEKLIEAMKREGAQAREGEQQGNLDESDIHEPNLTDLKMKMHAFTDWVHTLPDLSRAANGHGFVHLNINNIRMRTQNQFTVLYRLAQTARWPHASFKETLGAYFIIDGPYVGQWMTLYDRLWTAWINRLDRPS
jgi:hypothetical protein